MWSHFIESYKGMSVILPDIWLSLDKELLFTDASGSLDFAAVLGINWFALGWESVPDLAGCQIAIKELFLIVLALEIRGPLLANKKLLFITNNMAIVHAINKQTLQEKGLMKLIRRLVLEALKHNILFKAKHIAGKSNTLADHLSGSLPDSSPSTLHRNRGTQGTINSLTPICQKLCHRLCHLHPL